MLKKIARIMLFIVMSTLPNLLLFNPIRARRGLLAALAKFVGNHE